MRRRSRSYLVLLAAWAWACGADNAEAPRPPPQPQRCRGFADLMPNFLSVLNSGKVEGLRQVVENYLLVSDPNQPDAPPPINDVLRSIFDTLGSFAQDPPEPGATGGAQCAQPPNVPPLAQANPLCEMRRVIDSLVHQGNGLAALKLADPLVSGGLDYIVGNSPFPQSHPEVATVVSGMCQQSDVCQLGNGLDLVIGLTTFIQGNPQMLDDANALMTNPDFQAFLTTAGDAGTQYGGEDGVVALVKFLVTTIEGMNDGTDLEQLKASNGLVSFFPQSVQPQLIALINDAELMLDKNRVPNVLTPLKQTLNCYAVEDNLDAPGGGVLVRMVYRLAFDFQIPAFQINQLMATLQGLRNTDSRGSLLWLIQTFAIAIRGDSQALDSAAKVCATLFSTDIPPGQTQSNADLALPSIDALFQAGVASEAICAVDTLIYGCAPEGNQPACQ